jgi:hypothetical protein
MVFFPSSVLKSKNAQKDCLSKTASNDWRIVSRDGENGESVGERGRQREKERNIERSI